MKIQFVLIAILCGFPVYAKDCHVAKSGKDKNPGQFRLGRSQFEPCSVNGRGLRDISRKGSNSQTIYFNIGDKLSNHDDPLITSAYIGKLPVPDIFVK